VSASGTRTFRKLRKVRQPQLWWRQLQKIKGAPARQSRPHYGGVQAVVGLLIMSSLSACHAVLHMCVWGSQFWPL
jgi:hypothetical protein